VTQRCAERFWTDKIEIASLSQNLEQIAVSDQTTLEGLTQFATTTILRIALNGWQQAKYIRLVIREGAFCATLFQAVRKSLILNIRRDVRVVEGARLEIALTVCDGVLQISITVADPES
jgi:hypothetical protein